MKIKACIIEDEPLIRQGLEKQLKDCGHDLEVVGAVASIAEALPIINRYLPDVVFLDVDLGNGGSGFDLFEEYPNPRFEVIFVTGFDHHAVKAIRYSCLDYLLKPVSRRELQSALNRLKARRQPVLGQERLELLIRQSAPDARSLSKMALPTRDGYVLQSLSLIEYFESDGNYAQMHVLGGMPSTFVSYSLKDLEALLPDTFVRCHRSFLVNVNQIKEINKTAFRLHLESGKWVAASQRSLADVIQRIQS
jgi:two-component system LytT family response regulator